MRRQLTPKQREAQIVAFFASCVEVVAASVVEVGRDGQELARRLAYSVLHIALRAGVPAEELRAACEAAITTAGRGERSGGEA